jgi:hypothetical protein
MLEFVVCRYVLASSSSFFLSFFSFLRERESDGEREGERDGVLFCRFKD